MNWYLAKHVVRRSLAAIGLSVKRQTLCGDLDSARLRLIEKQNVDCVLDVGASDGRYALGLRRMGYHGNIVSFEPGSTSFARLQRAARGDHKWTVVNAAVGERAGEVLLNVAGNSSSSSVLGMRDRHQEVAPESRYVGSEKVRMVAIDEYLATAAAYQRLFVKVDVQGLEAAVLRGARDTLAKCRAVELEVSFEELYEGQATYIDLMNLLHGMGFVPCLIENVLCDESQGTLLQANVVFRRH